MASYNDYAAFNKAYGFSARAGFELTRLQIEDVQQFLQWQVSLNTYEVGGGKTVVSTVVSLMRDVGVTVVVVPPILLLPWGKWLNKVSERVVIFRGTPKERKDLDLTTARWIILSHALFRKDFVRIVETVRELGKHNNAEIIVDEAHALKNVESKLFSRVQMFTAGTAYGQLLTGTPISKPLDSYSYIKLKTPAVYRSMGHFEAVHVKTRNFYKVPTSYGHLDLLKSRFDTQTISRTKEEVHGYVLKPQFPDSEYELAPEHMALYTKLVDELLATVDDNEVVNLSVAQKLRHALQQVIVNYDYFSGSLENRSAALDLVDLAIEETECSQVGKSKLIIWTKYRRSTEAVLAYVQKLGMHAVAAYGGSDSSKAAEAFTEDEKVRVGVFQYQSANAGLNPQYVCNNALFLEGETVPIYMRQAIGRIDRVGQTKIPRVRLGVAKGTVQVGLMAALLKNDDHVASIETSKKSLRGMLLGG